jgi:hypothetical protein
MDKINNLNPLQKIILVAEINKFIIENQQGFDFLIEDIIIPIPTDSVNSKFERFNSEILYDNKELAGVAGLFLKLKEDKDVKIIYSNDLGSSITGIDCIAVKNNKYIICEAKGTTSKKKYISSFLKKTKTKGRQMSWDWIWKSIVNFADDSRNSIVFLHIYENVIKLENISRLVSISSLKKIRNKYTIQETKFYKDEDIKHLKGISSFTNQEKLKDWLTQTI